MLKRLIVNLVDWCWRHAWLVVVCSTVMTLALGAFAATHLRLDTDQSHMISANLGFRRIEQRLDRAFPQNKDLLVAVIDAPTADRADKAADDLLNRLSSRHDLFRSLRRPPEEMFFRRNGLLFLSPEDLTDLGDRLTAAQPLIGTVARDPSLRGFLAAVDLALEGVSRGQIDRQELQPMLDRLDAAAAAVAAGGAPPALSWQALFGPLAERDQPRRVLLSQPVLRYDNLVAGGNASAAIREAAAAVGITAANGMRLRLTGPVALADANFATVTKGTEVTTPLMILIVCGLLFLAVRSGRAVAAILLSLVVGLVAAAAFAAATVGTLNPISVAFAVMFVGIAVDFAIQFVVRYGAERHGEPDAGLAMHACARQIAAPLTLAAIATAVGFLSFLPTNYTGVSQLGLIAGGGMVIALVVDFTLLPALLALLRPNTEEEPMGLPLAFADRWLERHCRAVVAVAVILAVVGALMLPWLPLDFDPLHLQNPAEDAVSAFRDLGRDPDNGAYAVNLLAPSPAAAHDLAKRFEASPEVLRTMSLATFLPDRQEEKLAIIGDIAALLGPTLNPARTLPPPSAAALASALEETARRLDAVAQPVDHTTDLAAHLRQAAAAGKAEALQDAVLAGLPDQLVRLRRMLNVTPITLDTLAAELRRDWIDDEGHALLQILPKGNMENRAERTRFVRAVREISNEAAGMPMNIAQSGTVVVQAFVQAGLAALVAIGVLLGIMLRRLRDSLLVVLPLVMGALYTVIGCVVGGLAINYANIIALPLLLGIGVAFNIYFLVNWRQGVTDHLQSPTTRAVLFSALTTGSAFGSLALSPHLGTASMGFLLFLSLGLSVLTTFMVLPALFFMMAKSRP